MDGGTGYRISSTFPMPNHMLLFNYVQVSRGGGGGGTSPVVHLVSPFYCFAFKRKCLATKIDDKLKR